MVGQVEVKECAKSFDFGFDFPLGRDHDFCRHSISPIIFDLRAKKIKCMIRSLDNLGAQHVQRIQRFHHAWQCH